MSAKKPKDKTPRPPSPFEVRVMKQIKSINGLRLGDRQVQFVSAARRLEKRGYVGKGVNWYLTQKGEDFLKQLEQEAAEIKKVSKGVLFL